MRREIGLFERFLKVGGCRGGGGAGGTRGLTYMICTRFASMRPDGSIARTEVNGMAEALEGVL